MKLWRVCLKSAKFLQPAQEHLHTLGMPRGANGKMCSYFQGLSAFTPELHPGQGSNLQAIGFESESASVIHKVRGANALSIYGLRLCSTPFL